MPGMFKKSATDKTFRLTRTFSLLSLLSLLVITPLMAHFYRMVALDSLIQIQNEANEDLTRAFANSLWVKHQGYFDDMSSRKQLDPASAPVPAILFSDVKQLMSGSRVLKVKIFNQAGLIIFSTDVSQLGQQRIEYPGFKSAISGDTVSELGFREEFLRFDVRLYDREVLSSYLPVFDNNRNIIGVFEIYRDVTDLIADMESTQFEIFTMIVGMMLLLYAALFMYIRRADVLILRNEEKERQLLAEEIQYASEHDKLTALPNRRLLNRLLQNLIDDPDIKSDSFAMHYLAVDNFGLMVETYGHTAGDCIIMEIVQRVRKIVHEEDKLFRVANSDFVILQQHLKSSSIELLANRLLQALSQPFFYEDREISVNRSIGINLLPHDGHQSQKIIKNAESAMYRARETGRNRFAFFSEELNAAAMQRFELESQLHTAWLHKEFEVFYQPRLDAKTLQVIGGEALLRWRRDNSLISPALFITAMEESGLILDVGNWVLEQACMQCKNWQQDGRQLHVSVNMSVVQFRSGKLVNEVRNCLLNSGLDASLLELELTESTLANDKESTLSLLNELKGLGLSISIDDFGTGYSSLSYLMHFPIDYLKIDQSFVRDSITNTEHAQLTKTIVDMAKNLHLKTVAEGIEKTAHESFLQELGCDELQGFLYSRPLPADEFIKFIQKH